MERYHKFAALHRQAVTESAAGLPALDRGNFVGRELGLMWGDLSEEAKAEYHVGVDEPCERKPAPAKKVAASWVATIATCAPVQLRPGGAAG